MTGGHKQQGVFGRILKTLALHRPELRAWAMYDWANSAFITIVVTTLFPQYFEAIAKSNGIENPTATFSLFTTGALFVAAVIAPLLGAIADTRPVKKTILGVGVAVGSLATMALALSSSSSPYVAATIFGVANIAAIASFVMYDALLPHVAQDGELDQLSASGYALGYLGGGLLLAAALAIIVKPELLGLSSADTSVRVAFVATGLWWIGFSIPLFRGVREPAVAKPQTGPLLKDAISNLRGTFSELRRYPQALLFLVAFLLYNDGIGTIIRMAVIYGREVGIDKNVQLMAILLTQFVGIPFAFGFGMLAGKIGTKRSIWIGVVTYCGICVLGYFMTENWHFVLLAVLVAMVQGGTQALSRSLFASMIPKHKSSEFFALFAVLERFAGALGPLVFTVVAASVGSSRPAILAIIAFFIVGGFLLSRVDVEAGRQAVAE